jgi:hypothetical protein
LCPDGKRLSEKNRLITDQVKRFIEFFMLTFVGVDIIMIIVAIIEWLIRHVH